MIPVSTLNMTHHRFFLLTCVSALFPVAAHAIDTATQVPFLAKGVIERAKMHLRLDGLQDEGLRYRLDLDTRMRQAEKALTEARLQLDEARVQETNAEIPEEQEKARKAVERYQEAETAAAKIHTSVLEAHQQFYDFYDHTPVYAGFVNSGAKYYNWKGNNHSHGSQYLIPVNLYASWQNWSLFVGSQILGGGGTTSSEAAQRALWAI